MSTGRAWSYGEISPSLQKRVDLDSYARSAKTLRNFKVKREGGLESRPGTKLSAPTKYGGSGTSNETKDVILRPFIFNNDTTNVYVLEIGHQYIRFHKNGSQIRNTSQAITGITKASTGVVTYTGADPTNGDEVYITGVYGMNEVNNRWYKVANVNAGANTFELNTKAGGAVSTSSFGTYTSGGTFAKPYEVTTTYNEADLRGLSFDQSGDTIIICGGVDTIYYPKKLVRTSDTSWAISSITPSNYTIRPYGVAGTAGAAGAKTFRYKVTAELDPSFAAIYNFTAKETLPGTATGVSVTAITKANPAVVTATAHGFSTGDSVIIEGNDGMTQIDAREFQISVASAYTPDAPITITSISNASPMVVTKNSHGLLNGDKIVFSVTGMTELNDITYGTVTNKAANTFEVYYFGTTTKIDSTGFAAFTAGTVTRISPNPTATNSFTLTNVNSTNYDTFVDTFNLCKAMRTHAQIDNCADPTSTAPNVISWSGITIGNYYTNTTLGVKRYVIYKETNGVYGFIGTAPGTSLSFNDIGITPDAGDNPYNYVDMWQEEDDYPYCVAFGKQRLLFGGSNNNPNRVIGSVKGYYYNFSVHSFSTASDAITIDLLGGHRNQIVRSMKEVAGRVLAFCSEGEFGLGDDEGVLDATAPSAKMFSANGSTSLQALLISNVATYVQARSSQVRDLGYSFEDNGYKGEERSIRSSHLFKGHSIVDWCYQQVPDSVIWALRDDGVLLACTYVREQQMAAWHRHDATNSLITSIACVPGDGEDVLYMVVERNDSSNVDGYHFVEVMQTRRIDDIVDGIFTDSTVTFDGRNTSNLFGIRLENGTNYTAGEPMDLSAPIFGSPDFSTYHNDLIGNEIHMTILDSHGENPFFVKVTVTGYTNATTLVVTPDRAIPSDYRVRLTYDWGYAFFNVYGLWNMAGEDVSVLGDGFVEGSALNSDYGTALTVSATTGKITMDNARVVVHVGLPIVCDLETLDIDSVQAPGGGLLPERKIVNRMDVAVEEARGMYISDGAPEDDDENTSASPIFRMETLINRRANDATYDDPQELTTDTVEQDCPSSWNTKGKCFIRQLDPLPATILAVMPQGRVPV